MATSAPPAMTPATFPDRSSPSPTKDVDSSPSIASRSPSATVGGDGGPTAAPSPAPAPPKSGVRLWLDRLLWLAVDQWFLLVLALLILIASQVQVSPANQATKQTVVNYTCPTLIFLITGATLPTKTLIDNYARWKLHLYVQGASFLICSASVFGIVSAIASNNGFFDPALLVGLIFMSCSPTTISSNVVMTRSAHGNDAVTVVESTLGNVLAPFITPLLVRMYLSSGAWYTRVIPLGGLSFGPLYRRVFKQLGLSLLLPLVVGQIIQNVFPRQTKELTTKYKLSKAGSLALLVIIWSTYDKAFSTGAFDTIPGSNSVILVFLSTAFYGVWLALSLFFSALARLPRRDAVAVAYCVPAKTPAMGVPLAGAMFATLDAETAAKLQIPLVIFQGLQIAAGSIGTIPFRAWVRRGEEREERERLEREGGAREKESV